MASTPAPATHPTDNAPAVPSASNADPGKGADGAVEGPAMEAIKLALQLADKATLPQSSQPRGKPQWNPDILTSEPSGGSLKQNSLHSVPSFTSSSTRPLRAPPNRTPRGRHSMAIELPQEAFDVRDQKLLRMKATFLSPVFTPRNRNTAMAVVPPEPPTIATRRKDHTLEGYLFDQGVKPDSSRLDKVPKYIGSDNRREDLRQSVRDRSGMSYVSHQMTGTAPMLRRLGFRPKTANRGPGGDLAKILATDTTVHDSDRVPDAAPANRTCNFEPVGPSHMRHVIPALCGHSEREWWTHPGLLRSADDRAIQALAQHLVFSDSWGRAVMVLCNLAYLSEKSKRFGYSAALRELKEAQLGLRFERKKFLDFRSWQDMYCAWSDQMDEYMAFWEENAITLVDQPSKAISLAIALPAGTSVSQDAWHKVQLADDISSEVLSAVKLETPEDAVHMASLMDDLTACIFSYGVPCTAGTEHEAIEKGRGLLDEWRAAVESEQGGVEKVLRLCVAPLLKPPAAFRPKIVAKKGSHGAVETPPWVETVRQRSEGGLQFARLCTVLGIGVDHLKKAGEAQKNGGEGEVGKGGGGGGARVSAVLYLSTTGCNTVERERWALQRVVLPAAYASLQAVGVDLTWRDLRSNTLGDTVASPLNASTVMLENPVMRHLGDAGVGGCTCMLVLSPSKGIKALPAPLFFKMIGVGGSSGAQKKGGAGGEGAGGSSVANGSKDSVILDAFKQYLSRIFDSIYDAWAFYDINGDWDVSRQEFTRMCRTLNLEDSEIDAVVRVIDKDGYGEIDPHEFMGTCAWHEVPDGGSFEANEKALTRSKLRRKHIFMKVQEQLRSIGGGKAKSKVTLVGQSKADAKKDKGGGKRVQIKGRWIDKRLGEVILEEAATWGARGSAEFSWVRRGQDGAGDEGGASGDAAGKGAGVGGGGGGNERAAEGERVTEGGRVAEGGSVGADVATDDSAAVDVDGVDGGKQEQDASASQSNSNHTQDAAVSSNGQNQQRQSGQQHQAAAATLQDLEVEYGCSRGGVRACEVLVRCAREEGHDDWKPALPLPNDLITGASRYTVHGESAASQGMGDFCRLAYEAVLRLCCGEGGVRIADSHEGAVAMNQGSLESQRLWIKGVLAARRARMAFVEAEEGAWTGHGYDPVAPLKHDGGAQGSAQHRGLRHNRQTHRGSVPSSRKGTAASRASVGTGYRPTMEQYAHNLRSWADLRVEEKVTVGVLTSHEGGEQTVSECLALLLEMLWQNEEERVDVFRVEGGDDSHHGDDSASTSPRSPRQSANQNSPPVLRRRSSGGRGGSAQASPTQNRLASVEEGADAGAAKGRHLAGDEPGQEGAVEAREGAGGGGESAGVDDAVQPPPIQTWESVPRGGAVKEPRSPLTRNNSVEFKGRRSRLASSSVSMTSRSSMPAHPQRVCWYVRKADNCVAEVVPQLVSQIGAERGAMGGAPLSDLVKALSLAGKRGSFNTLCILVGFTEAEASLIVSGAAAWQEQEDKESAAALRSARAATSATTAKTATAKKRRHHGGKVRIIVSDPGGHAAGVWSRAVSFPSPPPLPLDDRMAIFESCLGPTLAKQLAPTQARAMCMRTDAANPEYLKAASCFLCEMSSHIPIGDAALCIDGRLDDVYGACVLPLLEELHTKEVVKGLSAVLLQSAIGVTEAEINVLLSSRNGEPLPPSQSAPLLSRLRPFLSACGAWVPANRLVLRSASLAGAMIRRYDLAHIVPSSSALPFSAQSALVPPHGTGSVGDIDAVSGVMKNVAWRTIREAGTKRGLVKAPPVAVVKQPPQDPVDGKEQQQVETAQQPVIDEDEDEDIMISAEPSEAALSPSRSPTNEANRFRWSEEELLAPSVKSDPGDGGWDLYDSSHDQMHDLHPHLRRSIHVEASSVGVTAKDAAQPDKKATAWRKSGQRMSMKVPKLKPGENALSMLRSRRAEELLSHEPGVLFQLPKGSQQAVFNVAGDELESLKRQAEAAMVKEGNVVEEILQEITDGVYLDRGHMYERRQASVVLPKMKTDLVEIENHLEFARAQGNDVAVTKCKQEIEGWREKYKETEGIFSGALSDDVWLVKSACDFEVNARIQKVPAGVYKAVWHLHLVPDMDFDDIEGELECFPSGSAGPLATKSLPRSIQERCKTGRWSHAVVEERFYVGSEGCTIVARLRSGGHWVSGLTIDRFVLIPVNASV